MRNLLLVSTCTACLALASCMTVQLSAEGFEKPAAMSSNVGRKFTIVKHFSRDLKGWFVIFNLATVSDPNVAELLRNEMIAGQGDAVINVKIQGQTTFIDGAIPVALGVVGLLLAPPYGVYASNLLGLRTYTVEGDVIRYSE